MFLRSCFIALAACVVLLVPLLLVADAEEPEPPEAQKLPTVASEILFDEDVLNVTPEKLDDESNPFWHVTAGVPNEDEIPEPGVVLGLSFKGVTAKFDVGAIIVVLDPEEPVSIVSSMLELSWSGIAKTALGADETEWVQEKEESDEDFAERQKQHEQKRQEQHEQNYRLSNFGGFVGANGLLDILVDDSTITFSIAKDEPEGVWYIDGYNIHIAEGGATVNIDNGVVVARSIDDFVAGDDGDEHNGGDLTKIGGGTLIIGGAWHDTEHGVPLPSGLNISGTLTIEGGTIILAGDRELAAGDRDVEGSAATTHQAGNIIIGEGATLDVSIGAMLTLTGSEDHDIEIRGGTLRVASAEGTTGIYNIEKYQEDTQTTFFVDNGKVEIYMPEGGTSELMAFSVDTVLGSGGGIIDVAGGISFESGAIFGDDGGEYLKTGEGTHVINGVNMVGDFVVGQGTVILNTTDRDEFWHSNWPTHVQNAGKVIINGKDAVLDITGGVILQLNHDNGDDIDVVIASGGTLKVASSEDTLFFHKREHTNFLVDGGTIHIYKQEGTEFDELNGISQHAFVGKNGGTVRIDGGIEYKSGNITALDDKGDVIKTGAGTHHIVGNVNLGNGLFDVQQGIVQFGGKVEVGSLKGGLETTISMMQDSEQDFQFANFEIAGTYHGGGHNLTVFDRGTVTGTMTDVGDLTVQGLFSLDSGEHSAATLFVKSGTFDLKAGAMLQLTNDSSDYDVEVRGTLLIASADDNGIFNGIFKKNDEESPVPTNFFLNGGTVEIYMPAEGTDYLIAETMNITLGASGGKHGGTFIVPEGMTFMSGSITGTEEGAHYWKSGKGTHIINGFATKASIQMVDGTTILNSGVNEKQEATSVMVSNGATFEVSSDVVLALTGSMTIRTGGVVANDGIMTMATLDIAGGTLKLQVTPAEFLGGESMPATVSTAKLILDHNAKILIDHDQHQLGLGTHTYKNIIEVTGNEGITNAHLQTLNTHQMALYRSEWKRTTTESGDSLDLTVRFLTVLEYAGEIGWKQGNALAVAGLIDSHVGDRYQEEEAGLMRSFSAPAASVNSIRERLEDLSGEALNTELRAAMAGELIGNAARMVMNTPYRMVFQHLDLMSDSMPIGTAANQSLFTLGQTRSPNSAIRLWFNPYAQSEKGNGDINTFDGYALTRVGFMLGGDANLTDRIVAGVVFNYGNPNVKSDLGKVKADDFMIGAYAKVPIYWQITANAMIGYGMQKYTYKGGGGESQFDGNTIFGSLELARTFPVIQVLHLTPVIGVDFQSISMDDLSVQLPTLGRMPIRPDGLDTASVRVGLRGECLRIRTRVQYIRQVAGDDYMKSAISLKNTSENIRSVQWGKDWINVGLGGELVQRHNFHLFADYDLDASKNTTSHLGSISAILTW